MARYWWQPDPSDLGNSPDNFTVRIGSAVLTVMQDAGGDFYLEIQYGTSNNRDFVSIDSINGADLSDVGNTEVYLDAARKGTSATSVGVAHRFSGTTVNNWTGYVGQAGDNEGAGATGMRWLRCINGSNAVIGTLNKKLPTDIRYGYRSRSVDGVQSIKTWPIDEPEPEGFDLSVENTEITQSGRIAFYEWTNQAAVNVYGIGIGTDGDPAPTEPIPSGGADVELPPASASSVTNNPTVSAGASVSVPTAAASAELYSPMVSTAAGVELPTAFADAQSFNIEIAGGAEITLPAASASSLLYPVEASTGADVLLPAALAQSMAYNQHIASGAAVSVDTAYAEADAPDLSVSTGEAQRFVKIVHLSGTYRRSIRL